MANKKGKLGGGKKAALEKRDKDVDAHRNGGRAVEPDTHQAAILREKRLESIRPWWEKLVPADRDGLLRLSLKELTRRAIQLEQETPGDNLPAVLVDALERLRTKGSWKRWRDLLTDGTPEFDTANAFRAHLREKISADTGSCPFRDDKMRPTAAEKELRERMSALLERVRSNSASFNEELQRARNGERNGRRLSQEQINDALHRNNVEGITLMIDELHAEASFLHDACLNPILHYVNTQVPADIRRSSTTELDFADLELNVPSSDVASIYEFVSDKIQEYSAERPDPSTKKPADGVILEDVDLFALAEGSEGDLVVNPKWLQHLKQRQMGENARICRVTERGLETEDKQDSAPLVDCPRGGLVLDWVFHKIVNTAEKARTSAQTVLCVGPMSPDELTAAARGVYSELCRFLAEHTAVAAQKAHAKDLLAQVLRQRKARLDVAPDSAAAGSSATTSPTTPPASAGAAAAASALRVVEREQVLVQAKATLLGLEAQGQAEAFRAAQHRMAKCHPELKRVQQELEDLDRQGPRPLEGPFRTAAEMERQKQALVEQAGEDRMELMQELKLRSTQLNTLAEQRDAAQAAEEAATRERKQLEAWLETLKGLAASLQGPEEVADGEGAQAALIRYQAEVVPKLFSDDEDRQLFDLIKGKVKEMERHLDRGEAALMHQEMRLLNLCCYDPGALIGEHLTLPYLQDEIAKASDAAAEKAAKAAEEAILRQVQLERERKEAEEAEERRRKEAARQRALERKRQEQAAKEAAAAARQADGSKAEAHKSASPDAAEQERKRQEAEQRRRAEDAALEAALEARRQQLMAEGGHWKMRAEQQALEAALLERDEWLETRKVVLQEEAREKHAAAEEACKAASSGSSEGEADGAAGRGGERRRRGRGGGGGGGNKATAGSNNNNNNNNKGQAGANGKHAAAAADPAAAGAAPSAQAAAAVPAASAAAAAAVPVPTLPGASGPRGIAQELLSARVEILRMLEVVKTGGIPAGSSAADDGAASLQSVAGMISKAVQQLQALAI